MDANTYLAAMAAQQRFAYNWFALQAAMTGTAIPPALTHQPGFTAPGMFPGFVTLPGMFTPAGPSWMNQTWMNQAQPLTVPPVVIKTEPVEAVEKKESPVVVNPPTVVKPIVKVEKTENATISLVRPENGVWGRLWAIKNSTQALAQPMPTVHNETVNENAYPAFMPIEAILTQHLATKPNPNNGNGAAIPRHEIECDIEHFLALEFRKLLNLNVEDKDELCKHESATEHRGYFKLLKAGAARKCYPIYKKPNGKRRSRKSLSQGSAATEKKIKLEPGTFDVLVDQSYDDISALDLNDSYSNDVAEPEIEDVNYNLPEAPENASVAAMRRFRQKHLEVVTEQKLTKYDIDLDKVEYNAAMKREYPQVVRDEKYQKKRLQNTKSARISRLRSKAQYHYNLESLQECFRANIEKKRFIACTYPYIAKLLELQNMETVDLTKEFEEILLALEAPEELAEARNVTSENYARGNE